MSLRTDAGDSLKIAGHTFAGTTIVGVAMFIRMIARSAIFVCILVLPGSAESKVLYEHKLAGWTIGAYANDATGEFSHCATSVPYRSGVDLVFWISRDFHWRMGLVSADWQLTPGTHHPVIYQIDNGKSISADAQTRTTNGVAIDLLDSNALFSAFQRGRTLKVIAAGQTFYFDLTNSSKVLAAMLKCTQINVAAVRSNPFETGAVRSHAPKQAARADLKAEAATFTANLLSAAGIRGFRMVSEVPQEFDGVQAIWAAPGLLGAVAIDPDSTVEQASTLAIASSSHRCKGRFASARRPGARSGAASIETVCEEPDGQARKDSIILAPRKTGGVYVIATYGVLEANAEVTAQEAGGRLLEASYKVLEP